MGWGGPHGLPQAGHGGIRCAGQEACSLLAGALRVSRTVKRWLSLLLGMACSRDATREIGAGERTGPRVGRDRSPDGGALLSPPRPVVPGSSFVGVPGAGCSGGSARTSWALTGPSGSLCETCFRTSPVGPQEGEGMGRERALDPWGSRWSQSAGGPANLWRERSILRKCACGCVHMYVNSEEAGPLQEMNWY